MTYLNTFYATANPKPTFSPDRTGLSTTKVPFITVELEGMERRVERRQDVAHLVFNILHTSRANALTASLAIRETVLERMPQTEHANGVFALDVVEDIGLSDLSEMETQYQRYMFSVQLYISQG